MSESFPTTNCPKDDKKTTNDSTEHVKSEIKPIKNKKIVNASSIHLNFTQDKNVLNSIENDRNNKIDILTQSTLENVKIKTKKERRHSFPYILLKKNISVISDQQTPPRENKLQHKRNSYPLMKNKIKNEIENEIKNEIMTPQRIEFACYKAEKKVFSKSYGGILKPPRSPKSPNPKKVRFSDNIHNEKRLSLWYHIDSPKRKNRISRKPSQSSHTKEGSLFSTDLDDPDDFGPYHNPNPGFLGDYDYQNDDDLEDESIWDYCCNIQ